MRLYFREIELVQCSLFANRSWHQALGFWSYMSVAYLACGRVGRLEYTKLQ